VHASTVSRALDPGKMSLVQDDTREHVRRVAERLGYRADVVARSLRRRQTTAVGVVMTDLGNPVFAPVLRGISSRLESAGFIDLITETQDDHERFRIAIDQLLRRRVDALIVGAGAVGDAEVVEAAGARHPCRARRPIPDRGSGIPDRRGGRRHGRLPGRAPPRDLGHRAVAEIQGPLQDVQPFTSTGRRAARARRRRARPRCPASRRVRGRPGT
jgi:LacI family transcriptional regulator